MSNESAHHAHSQTHREVKQNMNQEKETVLDSRKMTQGDKNGRGGRRQGAGRPRKQVQPAKALPPFPEITSREDVLNTLTTTAQLVYEGKLSASKGKAIANIIRTFHEIKEDTDYRDLEARLERLLATTKHKKQAKQPDPE